MSGSLSSRSAAKVALLAVLAAGCGSSVKPATQPPGPDPAESSAEAEPLSQIAGNYLCAVGPAPVAADDPNPTELPCQLVADDDNLSLTTASSASGWRVSGQATRNSAGLRLTGQLTDPDGDSTPIEIDLYRQTSGFAATAVGTSGQLIEIDLRPATETR